MLSATKNSYGIVTAVARVLGCEWHTALSYINHWQETRRAFEDENERSLDFSESQLLAKIREGDGPMIRFHLSTKGRHRGYVERQEVEHGGGMTLNIVEQVVVADDHEDDSA